MVLIASMVVPANAAPVVLKPLNYANGMSQTTEGTTLYSFRFKGSPYYECYNGTTLAYVNHGSLYWEPDTSSETYRISVSPLGNITYDGTVIDVRDFKTGAVLDVTFHALMHFDLNSQGSTTLTYTARSQMTLYWFDKDFNFIKSENCGVIEKSFTWGNIDAWLLQNSFDMEILDEAAYVSPRFLTQIYRPSSGAVTRVKSTDDPVLDVTVEKDDVNAESKLLEEIEKQLDDLNDKTDVIINGTPEINDKIDDMEDDVTNQKDDMHIVEDAEKEYLDQWEESNNEFKNKILTFLQGVGWVQLADLLSPFMNWSSWTTVMIMVVAFVNLSVILFGR